MIRTLQSENAPACVKNYLYYLNRKGRLDNPIHSIKSGGLMYDGEYYYPLDDNKVLYYNLLTRMAYILSLKYPAHLTPNEVNAIERLKMSDGEGARHAGIFINDYRCGLYGKNKPCKPFPYELLPYLPAGLYNTACSIVVSTMGIVPTNVNDNTFLYPTKNYRYGQGCQIIKEEKIKTEQREFGLCHSNIRYINPLQKIQR